MEVLMFALPASIYYNFGMPSLIRRSDQIRKIAKSIVNLNIKRHYLPNSILFA